MAQKNVCDEVTCNFLDTVLRGVRIDYVTNLEDLQAALGQRAYDILSLDGDLGARGGREAGLEGAGLVAELAPDTTTVLHSGRPDAVGEQAKIIPWAVQAGRDRMPDVLREVATACGWRKTKGLGPFNGVQAALAPGSLLDRPEPTGQRRQHLQITQQAGQLAIV